MEVFGMHIELDKWFHFLIIAMPLAWMLVVAKTKPQIKLGFLLCFLVATGKELFYDMYLGKGHAEWLDFIATMILPVIGFGFKLLKR